jgi:hypothetical protein
MLDTSLIETLRRLTVEEQRQLDLFVHSRFFYYEDNAKGVIALFEDLMAFAPHFTAEELDRAKVAKRLKQTPQYLTKVASGLHAVVRKFITYIFSENTQDDFFGQVPLLRFYQERGLTERFEMLHKRLEKDLNTVKGHDSPTFNRKKYAINRLLADFQVSQNVAEDHNIRATMDSLDELYLLEKTKLTYDLLYRRLSRPFDTEGYLSVIEEIKIYQKKKDLNSFPILNLFFQAILLISKEKKSDFMRFQTLLSQHDAALTLSERLSLNGLSRQILMVRYGNGEFDLETVIFDLYRNHLYRGFLYQNGRLQMSAFSNIVRFGCRAGKINWVECFLKKFEDKLVLVSDAADFYRINYAYFLLHKGEWQKAEAYLSQDFNNITYRLYARRIELMVLCETHFDGLDYKIDSFRKFIRNNAAALPEAQRDNDHNFALVLRKMLNPDLKRNNKRIEKLIEDIRSQATSEAAWLMGKLEKLKRKIY